MAPSLLPNARTKWGRTDEAVMEKDGLVRAIGRGLAVLKVINHHGSLNMMNIAKLSAMPYPTACRIVDTLIEEGMIEREPGRKFYRATPLVKSLSQGYRTEDDLAASARGPMIALTKKILWPVTACSRVGLSMMIRESSHRISPKTLNVYDPGYTIPILGCSAGMAYLAHCPDDERVSVLRAVSDAPALDAWHEGRGIERMFQSIRQNGFSTLERCYNNANPGRTSSISAPVVAHGACTGSLTVVFFCSAMTTAEAVHELAEPLCEASREIGAALEGRWAPPRAVSHC